MTLLGLAACGGGSSDPPALQPLDSASEHTYTWMNAVAAAPFAGRDGAGALVFTDPADGVEKVWLLGGWNTTNTTDFTQTSAPGCCTTNEVWKSADGISWERVKANTADGWEGRHMAGWTVFNGKMWVIGGDDNSGHYQTDVWNSSDGAHWTQVASSVPWAVNTLGQPGRVLHYTIAFNGRLWVIGGQALPAALTPTPVPYPTTPDYYSDIWSSSDGVHWDLVGSLPHALGMICGAVVFNGQMWVIGGGTYGDAAQGEAGVPYDEVWSSADGAMWTQHFDVPWPARRYHSVAVFDNRIWVVAGLGPDGAGHNKSDVWYSSDGDQWTQLPNTPWDARHAASVFVLGGALWITGGTPNQGEQKNDIWRLEAG